MASNRFITVTAPKKIGTIGALPSAVRDTKNKIAHKAVVAKQMIGAKIDNLGLGRFIRDSPFGLMDIRYYNPNLPTFQ